MTEKDEVLKSLEPLFEKAEKEGLYFVSNYQQIWFSPKELKEKHDNNSFLWGAVNWQLRDPSEETERLKEAVEYAKEQLINWETRLLNGGTI